MEQLKDSEFFKFNPDTLEVVRKEFGLDQPGILKQSLDILEAWVEKQPHFMKKDFSRDYLERTLITCKGSVEKTKVRLDKLCTMKNLLPEFFENLDLKAEMDVYEKKGLQAFLPRMTPTHERVYLGCNRGFKTNEMMPIFKVCAQLFEFLKAQDYSLGLIIILDFSNVSLMEFLPKFNPTELRNILNIIFEGYGQRLKGMHIVSSSKMIDALITLFKQAMSAKLGERIYVHKTVESLLDIIPREIMPKEYGGDEKTLQELQDDLLTYMAGDEYMEYLKEMSKARTDESLRSSTTFNEQYMGVPGSFKMLRVD